MGKLMLLNVAHDHGSARDRPVLGRPGRLIRVVVMSAELVVVQVPIEELRPDPANPRKIRSRELDALTRSLGEFGFRQPVIARRDGTVIAGHQRLVAARPLGINVVPVVVYVDHLMSGCSC